jgi:hypothetical protein
MLKTTNSLFKCYFGFEILAVGLENVEHFELSMGGSSNTLQNTPD